MGLSISNLVSFTSVIIDRNGLRFAAADQRNRGGEPQVPPPDHGGVDEPHRSGPALQVLGLNRGQEEEQHLGRPCGERQEGVHSNDFLLPYLRDCLRQEDGWKGGYEA